MSDRTIIRLLRAAAVIGGTSAVIGSIIIVAIGHAGTWWSELHAFITMFSVFFAVFVWLVIPQQPRNAVVWTMAAPAFFGGLYIAGIAAAALVVDDPIQVLVAPEHVIPADLPSAAVWTLMFLEPGASVGFLSLFTLGLLLFPDGRFSSPRWRWVGWLTGASMVGAVAGFIWGFRPGNTGHADENHVIDVSFTVLVLVIILSVVSLIRRFRSSSGATRDQFKWVVWGTAIFAPLLMVAVSLGGTEHQDLIEGPPPVTGVVFLGSYGIAVGKYRLFDIDLVISRTVVLAGLVGFITVVYAAVVGGVGLLFGSGTGTTLPLSIAATVMVAVAFQPLRIRMRRWADRLVYGERATPYDVLSSFSERMRDAVATEDVIPQMARLLTAGTGARPAIVWLKSGDELQPIAVWPEDDAALAPVRANDGEPSIPGADHLALVEHDGELLGAITVTMPRGEAMTATEERLVNDVAAQAGLVLRNARLIQELRSSRQRLVAAQDAERRRLERNLHDGAQQQLVALKIKLGLARRIDDTTRRDEMLGALMEDADDAIHSLRDLAHGIYPPLLEAEGLQAALAAQAAKAPLAVAVTANGLGRYSADVEAAVYFCVLEAIQNIVKYAKAGSARLTITAANGRLIFEVADDGTGFDSRTQPPGRGLINMADRLEALGGALEIRSTPGQGTTIRGSLAAAAAKPGTPGQHI